LLKYKAKIKINNNANT